MKLIALLVATLFVGQVAAQATDPAAERTAKSQGKQGSVELKKGKPTKEQVTDSAEQKTTQGKQGSVELKKGKPTKDQVQAPADAAPTAGEAKVKDFRTR